MKVSGRSVETIKIDFLPQLGSKGNYSWVRVTASNILMITLVLTFSQILIVFL